MLEIRRRRRIGRRLHFSKKWTPTKNRSSPTNLTGAHSFGDIRNMASTILGSAQVGPLETETAAGEQPLEQPLTSVESAQPAPVEATCEQDPETAITTNADRVEHGLADDCLEDTEHVVFTIDVNGDKSLAQRLLSPRSPNESPVKPPPKPLCGMCEEQEAKYKCPRCQLP